ncbi:hypothetical protein IMY05_C4445000100 [Salix suchowensis]|nr:hypothetical protein IMY05_C4445000100 [Salix suchowensis]
MASLRKKYDEDAAAHQIVIQELRARIKDLEHAYQQLGEDAQSRYQALKDDHKAQLHTLREQGSSGDAQLERVKDLEAQLTTLKAKSDRDLNDAQMQLEGLHQIQQHAAEDALTRYNQLRQATEDARRREAEAIRSEDIQRQVATELQARYARSQETHAQAFRSATTRDHTLRVTELQRESQEALCQLTEASEARYQRLVEESRQPGEIQAAISTAIADARRAAEDHFQTRTTEIQRENHELRTEISNLRATVEQLPVRQENMNANADKGKQRVVLNVHSYGRRPVVAPMSGPGSRPPASNIYSTSQTGPSRNTRPTISVPRPAPYPRIVPPTLGSRPSTPMVTQARGHATATTSRVTAPMAAHAHGYNTSERSSRETTPASTIDRDPTPTPTRPGNTGTEQHQQNAPAPAPTNSASTTQTLLTELRDMMAQFTAQMARSHMALHGNMPNRPRAAGAFSQQHEPKTRDAARIKMMNLVRNKLRNMLHIQHDSDIDASIERGSECLPELHPFRPLWTKINHPWNLELASLFAMEFCAEHPEFERKDVKDHFMTRLKVLHTNVTRNTTHADGGQAVRQLVRVRSRKSRRRGAVRAIPVVLALTTSANDTPVAL